MLSFVMSRRMTGKYLNMFEKTIVHVDVIKWTDFLRSWPFVWEIPLTKASDA